MSYEVTNNFLRYSVVEGFSVSDVSAGLYTNDLTPSDASVAADFTLVTGTPGLDNMRVGTLTTVGAEATQLYRLTLNVNGPETVYGIIIFEVSDSDSLFYAHRFASPINISSNNSANIVVDINRIFRQV